MAGIAYPNVATYERNETAANTRKGEVPGADFDGGGNLPGSCAPGIGINTGDYDPKVQDWSRVADTAGHESQHIGGVPLNTGGTTGYVLHTYDVIQSAGIENEVAFVETAGAVPPFGILDSATDAVNMTGKTVPDDSWAWGVIIAEPTALLVTFTGDLKDTETLTGDYDYHGADAESGSTFQWYAADDEDGTGAAAIVGATSSTYTLDTPEIGKFIAFEVTPSDGVLIGDPAISAYQGPVEP